MAMLCFMSNKNISGLLQRKNVYENIKNFKVRYVEVVGEGHQ